MSYPLFEDPRAPLTPPIFFVQNEYNKHLGWKNLQMKLEQTWYSLTSDNKWQVDKQIVNMELKKWFISALSNVEMIIAYDLSLAMS